MDPVINDPVTYHSFFSHISPFLSPITSVLVLGIGGLVGYGKLRATMVTYEKCKGEQAVCQGNIIKEIKEVKDLVIELYDKQTIRINDVDRDMEEKITAVDKKRHDDRSEIHKVFLQIQKDIGIISGYIQFTKGQNPKEEKG